MRLWSLEETVSRARMALDYHWLRLPQSIQVEITNACNLGCKMCPSNSPEATDYTRGRTLMDFDLYAKIIDEVKHWPKAHIIPQGGGEPFLHKRFRDMLILAKSHPNISIGFVTNGTWTNDDDARFLVDLGIEEICVSVYGYDAESHQRTTGRKNYDKVVSFLHSIADERRRRNVPWPRVRVQTVHTDEMDPHLDSFVRQWLSVIDEVAVLTQRDFTGRGIEGMVVRREDAKPCAKLWHETAISSDGVIGVCCEDWDAQFPLGDVSKQTIESVWYGEELQRIRRAHREDRFEDVKLCDGCYMLWEQPAQPAEVYGMRAQKANSVMIFRSAEQHNASLKQTG